MTQIKSPRKIVLSAIGKDQPGIVSHVTEILFRHRASIEDSSMTILEGEFAMIMIVSIPANVPAGSFRKEFSRLEKRMGLIVTARELKKKPEVGPILHVGKPYILSVLGSDKPGIVYKVSKLLARLDVNITDLNTKVIGREGGKNTYAMVLEVEAPAGVSEILLKNSLHKLGRSLRVDISLRPIESLNL